MLSFESKRMPPRTEGEEKKRRLGGGGERKTIYF